MKTKDVMVQRRLLADGTFAERLANVRAEAGFALWAIPYGADWNGAWSECDRPDWLIDAVALSGSYAPGSAAHRRMVALLCRLAEEGVRASGVAISDVTLGRAIAWAKRGWWSALEAQDAEQHAKRSLLTFPWRDLLAKVDGMSADEVLGDQAERMRVARMAEYFAVAAMVTPTAPVRCARAAAIAAAGRLAHALFARMVSAEFECPEELRIALPS